MGNVLCKNRTNRSGNTSNGKNPVDRVIGECMQICPNGIRKKKHFWEKQVFETAPPEAPLQDQPKSQQKNGWQNASLTVPDHPVAPPRKKRTLQRNIDPSDKNAFEEINLNGEIPEKYNERSVDPPEPATTATTITTTTTTTTTTNTNTTNNSLNLTNNKKTDVPQKVTRAVSKVGNKKSDKFFGESLSDLSNDYENNTTFETTKNVITTKNNITKDQTKSPDDKNNKIISDNKIEESSISKDKDTIIEDTKNSTDEAVQDNDFNSTELARESVVDLVEDIEEELNRKITKERGNLLFAMEKHLTEKKTTEDELDRFKDEKPVVEEVIVPIRKVKKYHVCDDDEKIKELVGDHPTHKHLQSKLEHNNLINNHINDDDDNNHINQFDPTAPKKPQRDFAKYRKSLNGDEFDIDQIVEAVNVNEKSKTKEKKENSTQTAGKLAVREKANHANQEAQNITKNVKLLINDSKNVHSKDDTVKLRESSNSPISEKATSSGGAKLEMKNFLDNIGKLQAEIDKNTDQTHNEIENVAKNLIDDVLDSAQNCIQSGNLQVHSEINSTQTKNPTKFDNFKDKTTNKSNKVKDDLKGDKKKVAITLDSKNQDVILKNELNTESNIKKDYLQEIITTPILKLSDKTTAALKEAQALKEELNSSLLVNSNISENQNIQSAFESEKSIKKSSNEQEIQNENITNDRNDSNIYEKHLKKEKSVEDCIDCMKNDASKIIKEVVEYAEKVVNDSKMNKENINNNSAQIVVKTNGCNEGEDEKIKKLMKKPSIILFDENGTEQFIAELKKEASQTVHDVCEYAQKTVNKNCIPNDDQNENTNNTTTKNIIEFEQNSEKNTKIDLSPSTNSQQKHTISFRPNRISEIIPPTQLQQRVFRRAYSTQSIENDNEIINTPSQTNAEILNEIYSAIQIAQDKSKSADNILDNDQNNHGLPPRPARNSEINRPSLMNSEKILRRCLSTQSYLTPNLIEKIALQANILSMPDPEDMGTNDGSSLVSPNYRLDSKRSVINSQSSLNSEKSIDSDMKVNKTAIVPPLPPKKPPKDENFKMTNDENKISNIFQTNQKNNIKKDNTSPLSSPPRTQKITPPITARSPITTRSPSPARPSRIPELPKSKLTKRLSRSTSKQSNPDINDIKKSQELSETLQKFLNEKDLKPQEILDLIEFEFGDDVFFELLSDNDKKIINELKKSVEREQQQQQKKQQQLQQRQLQQQQQQQQQQHQQLQQQKSSPPSPPIFTNNKPPQKSPPSRSASREILVRQNSQSSDSSSSKKSPDRLKSSRIPILKNNKINDLQNNNSEFRRHSIDDLDSWFNPIKGNLSRKRDNSLQLDYNFDENPMNSSLTEQNIAIKQFLDKKTKSSNDLSKSSISFNLTPVNFNESEQNEQSSIDKNDHSALLKYLENKN